MEHYYLLFVDHFTRVMNEREDNNPHPKHQKKRQAKSTEEADGNKADASEAKPSGADKDDKKAEPKKQTKRRPKKQDASIEATGDQTPELSEAV